MLATCAIGTFVLGTLLPFNDDVSTLTLSPSLLVDKTENLYASVKKHLMNLSRYK